MIGIVVTITNVVIEVSFALTDDAVVIVNDSKPNLSFSEVLLIFTGFKKKWNNGDKIKVLINNDGNLKKTFISNVLKMSVNKFYNFWLKKQSREGGALPREYSSAKIKALVSRNPKYIGFILRSEIGPDSKIKYCVFH